MSLTPPHHLPIIPAQKSIRRTRLWDLLRPCFFAYLIAKIEFQPSPIFGLPSVSYE